MDINPIIEQIIQSIKQEVLKPNMGQIPLAYVMTRNIPDSVKHFFDNEVEQWLREEQEKIFTSDRFDYDMPEVRMLLDQAFDILKNTATFSPAKFNQLLERAVKLEANYIIQPHRTLRQFLFRDRPIISTIEVYDLLRYFSKFNYYKEALTKYFNMKYLKEISEQQFVELITQIDNQVFSKEPVQSILKISRTILSFINGGREESDILETGLLVNAFEDRGLMTYAKIMQALEQRGFNDISLVQLEEILSTGKLPEQAAPVASARIEETAVEQEETIDEEQVVEDTLVTETEETDAAADLKSKLRKRLQLEDDLGASETVQADVEVENIEVSQNIEMIEEEAVAEAEEEESYIEEDEEEVENGKAQEQLADLVSKKLASDLAALPPVRSLITPKDKKRFIKKLFKKNNKVYDNLIKMLEDTVSWKQASMIIDNQFYENGVNPYSKEAIEFSDIIYNRYFAKEQEIQKRDFS